MDDFATKTKNAFKWSSITEIITRLIAPITNMILARILLPEAFGMLTAILMIIAFAEVFVESGFQKFLIQHEFLNHGEENNYLCVAFWANLFFSLFIWILIILFRNQFASLIGNDSLGIPLSITGIVIPIYGIIGIQNCRLRKSLKFKKLFYVRIAAALVPIFVTIPCALLGFDYWSLIFGNIVGTIVRAIMLFIVDRFKPIWIFSKKIFIHMISYGIWTLVDGIAVWATTWIDTLLISRNLTNYYLGIYKNSIATITEFVAIVTSAVTPVLFASLSKIQDDSLEFNRFFLSVQRTLCIFLMPMGAGLFFYRRLATYILFGNGWDEAADVVGIMAITIIMRTIFVSFYSDAYRAKGKFQVPFFLQMADLLFLIPTCMIALKYGFWALVYARAFARLDLIFPEIIIVWKICGITLKDTGKIVFHPMISTAVMVFVIIILQNINDNIIWQFFSIIICAIVYFSVLFLFKEERERYLVPILSKNKIDKKGSL